MYITYYIKLVMWSAIVHEHFFKYFNICLLIFERIAANLCLKIVNVFFLLLFIKLIWQFLLFLVADC